MRLRADLTRDVLVTAGTDPAEPVAALLAIEPVFGTDHARQSDQVAAPTEALAARPGCGATRCMAARLARAMKPADA